MTAMLPFLMSALSLRAPKPNLYRKTIWRRFPQEDARASPAVTPVVVIRCNTPIADAQSREREPVQASLTGLQVYNCGYVLKRRAAKTAALCG